MRWVALIALLAVLVGCRSLVDSEVLPKTNFLTGGHSITLEDYLSSQRELNERYLYGSPQEALKASESILELEKSYAKDGQRTLDSNHALMLANTRLFVLSEKLRQRPEAEMYLDEAIKYAKRWRPEVGGMPMEKQVSFIRGYLDDFEKGLEVRWKNQVQ